MVSTEEKSDTCLIFDIITGGQTEIRDDIADEIDLLKANYDGIKIVEEEGFYPKILLDLDIESYLRRRVTLEIAIVRGYPYVAPRVRILLPQDVTPESSGSLDESEVRQIQTDIQEAIAPGLLTGAPCIMQIICIVERVLSSDIQHAGPSCIEPIEQPAKPSLTQKIPEDREVVKLKVLLLHLLNKCCHLKNPESKEEASSNFQTLVAYFINEVQLIPKKLRRCVPWNSEYTMRFFGENLRKAMDGTDELSKWVWTQEEGSDAFQHSSPGKYRREFIQQHPLGSGGFASVFVCRKKMDGHRYAVKKTLIRKSQAKKAMREVKSLAALSHKNIVRYYDAWIEPGCDEDLERYLAMYDEDEEDEEEEKNRDAVNVVQPSVKARDHKFFSQELGMSSDEEEAPSNESDSEHLSDNDSWEGVLSTSENSSYEKYFTLYIQMELCSEQTLRHLIEECDRNDMSPLRSADKEKVAAQIFRQLLTAVAHFHREKMVHRDLKPENILFEMENVGNGGGVKTIRVADFGLARIVQPSVKRNPSSFEVDDPRNFGEIEEGIRLTGNLGSVLYCAPEQEQGEKYCVKVDEYSVGMIALEMWLAMAGMGFRERFNIMTDVSRGKPLPEWFCEENAKIAGVISSLIKREPSKRRSCEEVLGTDDLPGDPAEIAGALETIERYGDDIIGRVLHCVQRIIVNRGRKLPYDKTEFRETVPNIILFDIIQAVHLIGILHGAVSVTCYDTLVPMNPSLSELGVPYVIDNRQGVWALTPQPQLATAFSYVLLANPQIGSFYQLYYRTRPYAVFTTPVSAPGSINEVFLDPLLSFFHLLSTIDLTSKLDIVISHAHWMNATYSGEPCFKNIPTELLCMHEPIESGNAIRPLVTKIENVLINAGLLVASLERPKLVMDFVSLLLEVLTLFKEQLFMKINLKLDPALEPHETSVDRSFLEHGIILECRSVHEDRPVAFFCGLENFTSYCVPRGLDMSAVCLTVDLLELSAVSKSVCFPQELPLVLDGVVICQAPRTSDQRSSVLAAAVKVWQGNIRACLRADYEASIFPEAIEAKRLKTVLLDGNRLGPIKCSHKEKPRNFLDNAKSQDLCLFIRGLRGVKLQDDEESDDHVLRCKVREDDPIVEHARKTYLEIKKFISNILVVDADVKMVEESIRLLMQRSATTEVTSQKIPDLSDWLKNNKAECVVLPIFSKQDKSITFFVNQEVLRSKCRVKELKANSKNKK